MTRLGARAKLVAAMAKHGFANYRREWWHFTFGADDTGRSFDVPVNSHMEQAKNSTRDVNPSIATVLRTWSGDLVYVRSLRRLRG